MTIELPALETEPLIYFLLHSGVFVAALGAVFFLLGLSLGAALWSRYRQRASSLAAESEAQQNEIADLKRKLAEHALTPAPRVPAFSKPLPDAADAPALAPPVGASSLADVPAMPEVAAAPLSAPVQPKVRGARLRPSPEAALPAPVRKGARRPEAAVVAPFSFLVDDDAAESREPADTEG